MGIRKYHQKYRLAIRKDGKDIQPYFNDRESAEKFMEEVEQSKEKQLPFVAKNKKRSNAKAKDLPVGLTDSYATKTRNGVKYSYPMIRSIIVHKSVKIGTVSTQYGNKHTRRQAIKLTLKKRDKKIADFKARTNIFS